MQRPEQSEANVTLAMELGRGTFKSSTVSGWAGSSLHLELVVLPAGRFFTFWHFGGAGRAGPWLAVFTMADSKSYQQKYLLQNLAAAQSMVASSTVLAEQEQKTQVKTES